MSLPTPSIEPGGYRRGLDPREMSFRKSDRRPGGGPMIPTPPATDALAAESTPSVRGPPESHRWLLRTIAFVGAACATFALALLAFRERCQVACWAARVCGVRATCDADAPRRDRATHLSDFLTALCFQ